MDVNYIPMPSPPFTVSFAPGMEPPELAALHPPDVKQLYVATRVLVLDTKGTVNMKLLGHPMHYKLRITDYFIHSSIVPDGVSMEASYQLLNPIDIIYSKVRPLCADTLPVKKRM
jgi:hypothetical protein